MRHRKRKKAAAQTMVMAVVVVAALATLTVLAFSQVFTVRDVMVVGNRNPLREEVVTQSGVMPGDNLLSITEAQLRRNLEKNRYIQYVGRGFDYSGTLTLHISERLGMGVVNVFGLYYVLDETGMVLECAGSAYPETVSGPKISGFTIDDNSRVVVGERLPVRDQGQMETMRRTLLALEETSMLGRTSLLDVKNLSNMYVMTTDGAKIVLGDDAGLVTKLLIAREVLSIREQEGGLRGAKIDVSSGRDAHFIPAVLPTVTPVPTPTPTIGPSETLA